MGTCNDLNESRILKYFKRKKSYLVNVSLTVYFRFWIVRLNKIILVLCQHNLLFNQLLG